MKCSIVSATAWRLARDKVTTYHHLPTQVIEETTMAPHG